MWGGRRRTCSDGLLRCPTFEVVCRGSCPTMIICGLIDRNASITTLPFTDWIGSTTTATALALSCSKLCMTIARTSKHESTPG